MAVFADFNFKLLVVEKLMYDEGTLVPAFSIDARMAARGIPDPTSHVFENDLAYTVLDESRAFFEELEIGEELLASVDTLLVDGGLQVYYECSPVWDGEDDLFDVRSLDDLALLPNLREVIGAEELRVPGALERLAARGISVS
ncbi:hypothetical protein [Streptomyces sp. CAU 1734]|uniref:DUF6892 domain-containing protein n=1 Tax=Streptomyces sp. CAU 1734 TaxID=3140360 RepID=UPI00326082FB